MHGQCKICLDSGPLGEACSAPECAGWCRVCPSAVELDDPLLGRRIADTWTFVEPLGEGGFGKVYRALQMPLHNDVAVKVLHLTRTQPDDIARFEREARALATIRHPNVVTFLQTGVADVPGVGEIRFLVMEALQHGQLLSDLLSDQAPLSDTLVWQIFGGLLRGLSVVHAAGIIHRDVKPKNVILIEGVPKLLDFGLACASSDALESVTSDSRFRGSAAYAAPEQAWGEGVEVGPTADIYAVGCMLYEAFSGSRAWSSDISASDLLSAKLHRPTLPFSSPTFAALSPAQQALLRAAMRAQPRERPGDAAALLERLRAYCMSHSAREASPPPRVLEADTHTLSVELDSQAPLHDDLSTEERAQAHLPSPSQHNRLFSVAMATLILGGMAVYTLTRSEERPLPAPLESSSGEVANERDTPAAVKDQEVYTPPEPSPGITITHRVPAATVTLGLSEAEIASSQAQFPEAYLDLHPGEALLPLQRWERPALEVMPYEVTWEAWGAHAPASVKTLCPASSPKPGPAEHPATDVSALEAEAFCQTLGMRLPTSREWEAIARGPTGRTFSFGFQLTDERLAHLAAEPRSARLIWNVTPEGVGGLSGGVWEWVRCDGALSYCSHDGFGLRGGSHLSAANTRTRHWLLAAALGLYPQPELGCYRANDIGWRCVMDAATP